MTPDRLEELAALQALGALDGPELRELQEALARDPRLTSNCARFTDLAAQLLIAGTPSHMPPPGLRARVLGAVAKPQEISPKENRLASELGPGFLFKWGKQLGDWIPLRVPGAFVQLLSMNEDRGYAVVLGKLEPGTRYPAHTHQFGEEIYILSGDLHIGSVKMEAGDFHQADAGTSHGVNYSETGCMILAVISKEDLMAQFAAGMENPPA